MNGDEAGLLLRLKARLGDRRSAVTGQVFDSLLNLEREAAVEFVEMHLHSTDGGVRDEAALSLGGSRLPAAVAVLIEAWNPGTEAGFRGVLLRALSSSRQERAIGFLLDLVRNGLGRDAALAIDALKLHDDSPEIQALLEQTLKSRT